MLPAEGTRVYEAPSLPDEEQEVYHEPQALPTGGQGLGKGLKLYQEATVEGGQVEIKGTESKIMESMVDEAAYYQYGNKGTVPIAVECMNEPIYYKEGPRVLPAGEPELGGGSKSYQESSVTGGTKYEIKGTQSKVVDWMGDKIQLDVLENEVETNLCKCVDEMEAWRIENWEKYWETEEGQDSSFWLEDGRKKNKVRKINPISMKKLRRQEWAKKIDMKKFQEDGIWEVNEVLEEDIQEFEKRNEVIGSDVEALYPSLDVGEVGKIVEGEVLRTKIQWEDLDYLEGTRIIVLNRSSEYCRGHKLSRVLPVRRKRTGTRPGVTGKGPLGPDRGDQEQWCWPNVKLTEEEKP